MRLSRSLAPATVAVALVMSLPSEATPYAGVADGKPLPELFGSACRISVHGSHVIAYCHNPYVDTDRVSLHVECARWWDIDSDGAAVPVGPALTVRLTGRCWKEVRTAWITHEKSPA